MGPRCGPGTCGTLLHRRAARQSSMSGAPTKAGQRGVAGATRASRHRRRGAGSGAATRCGRAHSKPRPGGAPVAVGQTRSREAPSATWPRFGTRTRGSQSGADPRGRDPTAPGGGSRPRARASPAGVISSSRCWARYFKDDRGSRRRPRAAEGVVHRGPIARCAARAGRLSRGDTGTGGRGHGRQRARSPAPRAGLLMVPFSSAVSRSS